MYMYSVISLVEITHVKAAFVLRKQLKHKDRDDNFEVV